MLGFGVMCQKVTGTRTANSAFDGRAHKPSRSLTDIPVWLHPIAGVAIIPVESDCGGVPGVDGGIIPGTTITITIQALHKISGKARLWRTCLHINTHNRGERIRL
jgi:hypothetical protein